MEQLITIRGDAELLAHTAHLFAGITAEFSCAARDLKTWDRPGARAAAGDRLRARRHGVSVRKLLSPVSLATESARDHLRQVSALGARVRIAGAPLPHETILIDRRVAILAGPSSPLGREYTITTAPALVGSVHSLYEAAWESATDYAAYLDTGRPHLDPAARAILGTLSAGLTDEAAARRLGWSVRTYRRRVADLMTALDADSRFQAGARAATLGLTG